MLVYLVIISRSIYGKHSIKPVTGLHTPHPPGSPNFKAFWFPKRLSFVLYICCYQMYPGFKCVLDLNHFYNFKRTNMVHSQVWAQKKNKELYSDFPS